MGVRFPGIVSTTRITTVLTLNNVTHIVQVNSISPVQDFQQVFIWWRLLVTMGTAATGLIVNLKRGSAVADPTINSGQAINAPGGSTVECSGCWADTPGAVADQFYTIDLQQVAATGNATVNDACLSVMAL